MDILLNRNGDLHLTETGDIAIENSVAQAIRIRLKWFEGEWRWNPDEGLPYLSELLIKNPNIIHFQLLLRSKIFEVDDVTEVKDVDIDVDNKTRTGSIIYTALTDMSKIREEVKLDCQTTE